MNGACSSMPTDSRREASGDALAAHRIAFRGQGVPARVDSAIRSMFHNVITVLLAGQQVFQG